jgi:hypothetical protein
MAGDAPDPLAEALARRYFPRHEDSDGGPIYGTAGMFAPPTSEDGGGMRNAATDWWKWRNAKGWDVDPENLALAFAGPMRPGGLNAARGILERVARGERPRGEIIGDLTDRQFAEINAARRARGMPEFSAPEVRYDGRHHYASRAKDGDNIDEMLTQIDRSMDASSRIENQPRGPALVNPEPRINPRGETVKDQAVLNHRPQGGVDLFSAYGRGKRSPTPQGASGSTPASGSPEPKPRTASASGHSDPVKAGTSGSASILPPLSAETSGENNDVRAALIRALMLHGASP